MYQIVSTISLLIRIYLCYLTIDKIPIFKDVLSNFLFLNIFSLYIILMIISRAIVDTFYDRGDAPTFGAIAYFVIYVIVLAVMYLIMLFLTNIGVLPI